MKQKVQISHVVLSLVCASMMMGPMSAHGQVGSGGNRGVPDIAMLDSRLPAGVEQKQIQVGGRDRYFLVYRPSSYKTGNPVVLLLHGGGGGMRRTFLFPGTARWKSLADEAGFLLVAPNGINAMTADALGEQQTWFGLRPGRDGRRSTSDDTSFLAEVLNWTYQHHQTDRGRAYITGASNGGEMVFRFAIERPELIAAGVANISSLPAIEVPRAARSTPMMMMNGTDDPLMPFNGGPVSQVAEPVRPVQETVRYWAELNQIDPLLTRTSLLPDSVPQDGCRIDVTTYRRQINGPPLVQFYRAQGGGHITPHPDVIPLPPAMTQILGNQCRDSDGVRLAWDFMRLHRR
jgi:polyhydroxybutyrate depolymerase